MTFVVLADDLLLHRYVNNFSKISDKGLFVCSCGWQISVALE